MNLFFKQGFTSLRFSKIIKYAVGEIILIVLGILIAFQLSNWADNKKAKNIEIETLMDLKEALKVDEDDLDLNIKLYNIVITSCDTILALLDNKLPYEQKMNKYFSRPCMAVIFSSNVGPYETLKSRGLETISNDTIRNKVIRTYENNYNFLLRIESQLIDYVQAVEKNFYPTHFNQSRPYGGRAQFGDMVPNDFGKLREDKEYIHYIRTIRNKTEFFLKISYALTKKGTHDLINDLDSEIKRLE
jgi:hypothetical protein